MIITTIIIVVDTYKIVFSGFMKIFLFVVIVFFYCNALFSQKENPSKIVENNELAEFLSKKKNVNYLNKSGFYFLNVPKEKSFSNRLAGTISIVDTSKFDINKMDIDFLMNDYQYYFVTNWNTLLVLKSINHLKDEMKTVE